MTRIGKHNAKASSRLLSGVAVCACSFGCITLAFGCDTSGMRAEGMNAAVTGGGSVSSGAASSSGATASSSAGTISGSNGSAGTGSSTGGGAATTTGGGVASTNGEAGTTSGGTGPAGGGANPGSAGNAGTQAVAGGGTSSGDDDDDLCPPAPLGAVAFSVPSGTFQGTLSVALTTAEAGAEIRYTTDHTPPTASSTLYAGTALSFTATTDLRAQAFVSGAAVGGPAAAVYVARSIEQAHDLPVLVIDTYGTAIPGAATVGIIPGPGVGTGGAGSGTGAPVATERTYVDAALLSLELVNGATSLSAAPQVASPTAIRLRGSSSASYDKKPYRLEMREADGTDRNCPMLGMPRDDDWVLHAPYPDKALIRNAFVYELGRELSIGAPRAQLVELYLSTAATPLSNDSYQGVYLLVETVKNHKDRLNLQQLKDTDVAAPEVSGGYIFKLEYKVTDIEQELACPAEQTFCWGFLEVADPEPWVPEQQSYLTDFLVRYVNALHSAAPADPTTGYPSLMDTQSFVDQVIVNEVTRNLDAYTKSQFFHKDRDTTDPLLYAGPLWDYDLIAGVGTSDKYANLALDGWQYEAEVPRYDVTADWFPVLLADPVFHAALVARWQELRQGVLSDAAVTERITRLSSGLAAAAERNFVKWDILTTPMLGFFETPTDATWQGQVDFMNTWLLGRMAWIDAQWQ